MWSLKKFGLLALLTGIAVLIVWKIFAAAGWWIILLILVVCLINWVAMKFEVGVKTKP